MLRNSHFRNHEQILVFYRKQPTYNPQMTEANPIKCLSGEGSTDYNGEQVRVITENLGTRHPLTVQDFKYDKSKVHPTQKTCQR